MILNSFPLVEAGFGEIWVGFTRNLDHQCFRKICRGLVVNISLNKQLHSVPLCWKISDRSDLTACTTFITEMGYVVFGCVLKRIFLYRKGYSWLVLFALVLQWGWRQWSVTLIFVLYVVGTLTLSNRLKWDCMLLYSTPVFPDRRKESCFLVLVTVPFLWAGGTASLMCVLMFPLCFHSCLLFPPPAFQILSARSCLLFNFCQKLCNLQLRHPGTMWC